MRCTGFMGRSDITVHCQPPRASCRRSRSHSWPWWRCMSLLSTHDEMPGFPFSRSALSWAAVSVSCLTAPWTPGLLWLPSAPLPASSQWEACLPPTCARAPFSCQGGSQVIHHSTRHWGHQVEHVGKLSPHLLGLVPTPWASAWQKTDFLKIWW